MTEADSGSLSVAAVVVPELGCSETEVLLAHSVAHIAWVGCTGPVAKFDVEDGIFQLGSLKFGPVGCQERQALGAGQVVLYMVGLAEMFRLEAPLEH